MDKLQTQELVIGLLGIIGLVAVLVYLYWASKNSAGKSSTEGPSTNSTGGPPTNSTGGPPTGPAPANYIHYTVGSVLLSDDGAAQGATVKVSALFMGNPPYVLYEVSASGESGGPVGAVPTFKFGPVSAAQVTSFGNNLAPAYGTVTVTLPGYQTWTGNLRDGGTVVLDPV